MINIQEVHETYEMIEQEKLDVRTITMGISLLDCACDNVDELCDSIYAKITTRARDLVATAKPSSVNSASPSLTSASP